MKLCMNSPGGARKRFEPTNPVVIVAVANASGLEGSKLLKRAIHEEGLAEKEAVSTEEAVSRHFFGAPIHSYGNEPFWGQDRLEMLDGVIKSGREPIVVSEL